MQPSWQHCCVLQPRHRRPSCKHLSSWHGFGVKRTADKARVFSSLTTCIRLQVHQHKISVPDFLVVGILRLCTHNTTAFQLDSAPWNGEGSSRKKTKLGGSYSKWKKQSLADLGCHQQLATNIMCWWGDLNVRLKRSRVVDHELNMTIMQVWRSNTFGHLPWLQSAAWRRGSAPEDAAAARGLRTAAPQPPPALLCLQPRLVLAGPPPPLPTCTGRAFINMHGQLSIVSTLSLNVNPCHVCTDTSSGLALLLLPREQLFVAYPVRKWSAFQMRC